MQRITIEVEKNNDFQLLIHLIERFGIKIISTSKVKKDLKNRNNHLEIIEKGGNVSYIENPIDWQREQRKERELPLRD